ncbi:hypothetical protein FO519_001275 [Halicephalobus sp. NKZ332]|nr:hypothetical protein FO519_001275 [Halicephalobus sp. NKZ332]
MRVMQRRFSSSFSIKKVLDDYDVKSQFVSASSRKKGPPFQVVLPPPNVTGNLHIGHAVTVVIQDSICRFQRRLGKDVEFIPGFDHAGIATQAVVERKLFKEKGIRRSQVSQEDFLEMCNTWAHGRAVSIREQFDKIGASLDWERQYYTMDNKFSAAVKYAFCKLHDEGLIFRRKNIVNWCPTLRSTISDQEVDLLEVPTSSSLSPSIDGSKPSVQVGVMHVVLYQLEGQDQFLKVGTTRPETVFADMALAINPGHPECSKFIGKYVVHPLTGSRLPVISDDLVHIDKGTGILKVTPSHDFRDYEIAEKHSGVFGTEFRICVDDDGKLVNSGVFDGLDRLEARSKVVEELKNRNRYGGVIKNNEDSKIPVCSRTGDFIEPRIKEQWYLHCSDMYGEIVEEINKNRIQVYPSGNISKLFQWLKNPDPWCLSRQLDWGHRIPAFRKPDGTWTTSISSMDDCTQDTDVLDTWFSSALIPLIVNGWPERRDFPTSPINLMETGHDIVCFWVARMLALCRHLSRRSPFEKVLLHGLVRDSEGRKMSKSLGNVIDPLDVIDGISLEKMVTRLRESNLDRNEIVKAEKELIRQFPEGMKEAGPDALRFAILRHDLLSEDIHMSVNDLSQEGSRFCNKIWNLWKYSNIVFDKIHSEEKLSDHHVDRWILDRLRTMLLNVRTFMDVDDDCGAATPHIAFGAVKDFILNELCDIYLETTKKAVNSVDESFVNRKSDVSNTLLLTLKVSCAALEPFMPFVSSYIGETLPGKNFREINVEEVAQMLPTEDAKRMDLTTAVINGIRATRAVLGVSKQVKFIGCLQGRDVDEHPPFIDVLEDLGNTKLTENMSENSVPVAVPGHDVSFLIQVEESQRSELIRKLEEQLEKAEKKIQQKKLNLEKSQESFSAFDNLQDEKKKKIVEKARVRVYQAEKNFQSASNEAERIRKLIQKVGVGN